MKAINTIIERFITTSDDLEIVSEKLAKASFTICSWRRSPSQSGNEKEELYALAVYHWLLLAEQPGRGAPLLSVFVYGKDSFPISLFQPS